MYEILLDVSHRFPAISPRPRPKALVSCRLALRKSRSAVFKHALLGQIFLKYVFDSFAMRHREIEAQFRDPKRDYHLESTDFKSVAVYDAAILAEPEERDYYIDKNAFWVPALARWKTLQDSASLYIRETLLIYVISSS